MTDTPTGRTYQMVLPEITTALFACPDCGAVVWHGLRDKHDQLHEQIDGLISTTWLHAELIDADGGRLDEHDGRIERALSVADTLDSKVYRLEDTVRDVAYRADDAHRTAERAADAAASAGRGY